MAPRPDRLCLLAIACLAPLWMGARCGPATPAAWFDEDTGTLSIRGGGGADALVVSIAGRSDLCVNGGQLPIQGGVPTLKNTLRIVIDGWGGDDRIALDETIAPLPPATLRGGAGRDELQGGAGADELDGGPGDDFVRGGAGDDTIVWRVGDGLDALDGGAGHDALSLVATDGDDDLLLAVLGDGFKFADRRQPVSIAAADLEGARLATFAGDDQVALDDAGAARTSIVIDVGAGHDVVDASALTANVAVEVDGGDGDDDLYGGLGDDVIRGGAGADVIVADGEAERSDGLGGNDWVWAGDGDDLVYGGPGDDVLFGEDGDDVLHGDEDDDVLDGGPGHDALDGGPGHDEETNGEP